MIKSQFIKLTISQSLDFIVFTNELDFAVKYK